MTWGPSFCCQDRTRVVVPSIDGIDAEDLEDVIGHHPSVIIRAKDCRIYGYLNKYIYIYVFYADSLTYWQYTHLHDSNIRSFTCVHTVYASLSENYSEVPTSPKKYYIALQYLHVQCQDFRYEVYGLGLVSLLSVKNSEDVVGRVLLFKACSGRDLASWIAARSHWYRDHGWWYTLLGTNISPTKTLLKIIFLWDTLVPWKGFHYWKPVSLHDVQLETQSRCWKLLGGRFIQGEFGCPTFSFNFYPHPVCGYIPKDECK